MDDHHAFGKTENARRMVAAIDYEPEEILLIGDTIHDHEVAQEIGVDCCLIHSGHQDRNRLEACNVKVVKDFKDLTENG